MNHFYIVKGIRWKIFTVISLYGIISLKIVAQATVAQLSCHVQQFHSGH